MNAMGRKPWTKSEAHDFLAKGRWFGSLPSATREAIIANGDVRKFAANTTLYKIGDTVDGLYASLEGDIRSYAYGDEGEKILLRPFGPGAWFGDVHLLDDYKERTFEVRTASPAIALFLPAEAYRKLTADPAVYRAFVNLMCIHMRHTVRVLVEARSEAPRRTARALLRFARAHGVPMQDGIHLSVSLSQADLASLVGVSRQYMNELISRWEHEGLLRWHGKAQPVIDPERMRALLSPLDRWIDDSEDWV